MINFKEFWKPENIPWSHEPSRKRKAKSPRAKPTRRFVWYDVEQEWFIVDRATKIAEGGVAARLDPEAEPPLHDPETGARVLDTRHTWRRVSLEWVQVKGWAPRTPSQLSQHASYLRTTRKCFALPPLDPEERAP